MGILNIFSQNDKPLSHLRDIKREVENSCDRLAELSTNLANHVETINVKELNKEIRGQLELLNDGKVIIDDLKDPTARLIEMTNDKNEFEEQKNLLNNNFNAYEAIIAIGVHNLADYLTNFHRLTEPTEAINALTGQISALKSELENLTKKIETTEIKLEQFEEKKEPNKKKY